MKNFTEDRLFKTTFMLFLGAMVFYFLCLVGTLFLQGEWKDYLEVVRSREVIYAVTLSLQTATVASVMALIMGTPAAYALSRYSFPGKSIVDAVLDLPIFISPVAIGAMLLLFFNTSGGAAIEKVVPFVFEKQGIVIAQFTIVSALAVRLMKSTFDAIDPRYENVSRTLGLSKTRSFFRVTLPLAKKGLTAAAIVTWARAIGEFGATVTLAGATSMKTETLPTAIHMSFATADLHRASAVILVLVFIAASSLLVLRKVIDKEVPV